jgi:hypothetical protein
VGATFEELHAVGVMITKEPVATDLGGNQGYFAELEGNLWEVARGSLYWIDDRGGLVMHSWCAVLRMNLACTYRGGGLRELDTPESTSVQSAGSRGRRCLRSLAWYTVAGYRPWINLRRYGKSCCSAGPNSCVLLSAHGPA